MNAPKVSVCIVSYNHSAYLPTTIESVLAQTYKDIEIIIADDGSTDGSLEIIKDYAAKHRNIKFFTHPGHINKGISATCNLAIEKSKGEYISLIGSDDAFYPYAIEEQINCLEANKNAGIVCGVAQHINERGELLEQTSGQDIWSEADCVEKLILKNRITAPTVMVRRACYDEVGLYNLNLISSDHEMWLRILLFTNWKFSFINKPLAFYRKHGANVSLNLSRDINLQRSLLVLREVLNRFDKTNRVSGNYKLIKEEIEKRERKLIFSQAKSGKILSAIRFLLLYIVDNPRRLISPRHFVTKF